MGVGVGIILLGSKCNHKDPCKGKEGEIRRSKWEAVDVIPEARGWNDARKGSHKPRSAWWPPGAEKGKVIVSPLELVTLILDFWSLEL